jgi:hypothetical protein
MTGAHEALFDRLHGQVTAACSALPLVSKADLV